MLELENFRILKTLLSSFEKGLVVKSNTAENFYLNTNKSVKNKDMFFAAVQIRKSYVAYHLFPVYTNPELLNEISDDLKKRMQGKSCFNFKKEIDPELLTELATLTKAGFKKFVEIGYIDI